MQILRGVTSSCRSAWRATKDLAQSVSTSVLSRDDAVWFGNGLLNSVAWCRDRYARHGEVPLWWQVTSVLFARDWRFLFDVAVVKLVKQDARYCLLALLAVTCGRALWIRRTLRSFPVFGLCHITLCLAFDVTIAVIAVLLLWILLPCILCFELYTLGLHGLNSAAEHLGLQPHRWWSSQPLVTETLFGSAIMVFLVVSLGDPMMALLLMPVVDHLFCMAFICTVCLPMLTAFSSEATTIRVSPDIAPEMKEVRKGSWEFIRRQHDFQEACAEYAKKYTFKLEVVTLYCVVSLKPRRSKLSRLRSWLRSLVVPRMVLFHGTRKTHCKAIVSHGFKLPANHEGLMFGKGVYFADCPLKSWQYCFALRRPSGGETGHIIAASVELGRVREEWTAHPSLSPEMATNFDSVKGIEVEAGGALRVPEFVIYDPARAHPAYVFEVRQVDTSS